MSSSPPPDESPAGWNDEPFREWPNKEDPAALGFCGGVGEPGWESDPLPDRDPEPEPPHVPLVTEVSCAVCHESINLRGSQEEHSGTRYYHEGCTESGRRAIAAREAQWQAELRQHNIKSGVLAAFLIAPWAGVVVAFGLSFFLYSQVLILALAAVATLATAVVIYVHEVAS